MLLVLAALGLTLEEAWRVVLALGCRSVRPPHEELAGGRHSGAAHPPIALRPHRDPAPRPARGLHGVGRRRELAPVGEAPNRSACDRGLAGNVEPQGRPGEEAALVSRVAREVRAVGERARLDGLIHRAAARGRLGRRHRRVRPVGHDCTRHPPRELRQHVERVGTVDRDADLCEAGLESHGLPPAARWCEPACPRRSAACASVTGSSRSIHEVRRHTAAELDAPLLVRHRPRGGGCPHRGLRWLCLSRRGEPRVHDDDHNVACCAGDGQAVEGSKCSCLLPFSKCMRSHGAPNFHTPVTNDGHVTIRITPAIANSHGSSPRGRTVGAWCQTAARARRSRRRTRRTT